MATTTAIEFARIARALQAEARTLGLTAPAFRAPPHIAGENRTLRRTPGGLAVVAVNRWRDEHAVTTDMIAGTLAANQITGADADTFRAALWVAAGEAVSV